MCTRCDEINIRITRYLTLSKGINDKRTIELLTASIADLSRKRALCIQSEKSRPCTVTGGSNRPRRARDSY
jgi:hypothetical protein